MAQVLNAIRVELAAISSTQITLGAKIQGFNAMADSWSGAVDGQAYAWVIEANFDSHGAAQKREGGTGVYTAATGKLTRNTVWSTEVGNAQIGAEVNNSHVILTPLAYDFGLEVLTGTRTYYVNPSTGSDSNDGLTPATAFRTVTGACNLISSTLQTLGYVITLQLADGNYPGGEYPFINPGDSIKIVGNQTTPANVVFSNDGYSCIDIVSNFANWDISGVKFDLTGGAWGGILIDGLYNNVVANNFICTGTGGRMGIFAAGNYNSVQVGFDPAGPIVFDNFTNECAIHCFQSSDVIVAGADQSGASWVLSGTVSFSNGFVSSNHCSNITFFNTVFSGVTPTGKKYTVTDGSSVGSQTTLPGSLGGTVDSNSTYNGAGFVIAYSGAGVPTTATFSQPGAGGLYKDTSGGTVYMAYNDSGTIKKVALT